MSSNANASTIFVGVDVSKATLDVYRPDTKEFLKIENTDEAIIQLCSQLEIERERVQGSDHCMHAKTSDDYQSTCEVESNMADKMSAAID